MFKPIDSNISFPEMEKKWLKHWYEKGIVAKYIRKNDNSKIYFSFQDGPITANNPMGVHHAWGRTYKDLWQRFFNLLGYKERFQNGFDCQGLWVEVEVEKELGLRTKKDIENLVPGDKKASIAKFVELCKQRVLKYSAIQTEQSKRLGYFMDWDHSYYTMSDDNNYMIWFFLKKCYENGWIYKGRESVPWCPRCETAISQHEMLTEDYKEVTHESIIFELPIVGRKKENLLVWTTTPWTIPANIAVAVDKKLDYSLVEGTTGDLYWVAQGLIPAVFRKEYKRIVKTVKGEKLVGLKYKGPFDSLPAVEETAKAHPDKFHTVIATDENILPISLTEGTGLVHTAVSAGVEDFKLGKKYGLPMIPVISDSADYLPGLGVLSGKNAKKNPHIVFQYMIEREKNNKENWIFRIEDYTHRYPACWRCKKELVWKVEDEWYIAMDRPSCKTTAGKNNKTLRERMMTVAKKIKWMPEFGLERELDWLKNMHDWLISKKNRYWGLALPIYECKKCRHFDVIGSKEELKQKAESLPAGRQGWTEFEGHSPHKPYIDEVVVKCQKCQGVAKRIEDVGNPWLDAGIVPFSTIKNKNQGDPLYWTDKKEWLKWFPVDFITESFPGQFKNWFYSLIAMATVLENTNPFSRVLGFATLLGEDGRPMHKSWGNAIEFNEGADKIGVDVARWMYSRQNPADNMLFGYKKADEVRRQFYLLLWNIYKFFVEYANLDRFSPPKSTRNKPKPKNILDQWILSRFYQTVNEVKTSLSEFNAKDSALAVEKFVNDLSTWYIRRSRDRVWVNSDDAQDKKHFYETMYFILVNLCTVCSSFIPFVTEEIFTNLTRDESVHLTYWPKFEQEKLDMGLIEDMNLVREVAEAGRRIRKDLKMKLRQPLSKAVIKLPRNRSFTAKKNTHEYEALLARELNVKKIEFAKGKSEEIEISYDTELTDELLMEGKVRDVIRQIQEERKKLGVKPDQRVKLILPEEYLGFSGNIKRKVLAEKVTFGRELKVQI
jgi:isoleucyl-tRNA synthetase